MSIIIKGMKMPKEPMILILHPDGNISTEDYEIGANAKAIELPPHGRLIDADVLNDMINRSYPMTDRVDVHNGYAICQEMIKQLPTIIEAEVGER